MSPWAPTRLFFFSSISLSPAKNALFAKLLFYKCSNPNVKKWHKHNKTQFKICLPICICKHRYMSNQILLLKISRNHKFWTSKFCLFFAKNSGKLWKFQRRVKWLMKMFRSRRESKNLLCFVYRLTQITKFWDLCDAKLSVSFWRLDKTKVFATLSLKICSRTKINWSD